jgi:hypothetical protein
MVELIDLHWPLLKLHQIYASSTKPQNFIKPQYKKGESYNLTLYKDCLAVSLTYPSGEEEGNFLVQMISTCPSLRVEEGVRESTPCGRK